MATEIAATLAFSAIQNNDKIGVVFFSDKIEKYIPPKKGRKHILYIIREMLDFKSESRKTDVKQAVEFLTNVMKHSCTAFVLSDMLDVDADGCPRYEDALKVAVNRHDLSVMKIYDPREREIPDVGIVRVKDSESGESAWINTSRRRVRDSYAEWFRTVSQHETRLFNKYQVDSIDISTGEDYVKRLLAFFNKK